MNIFIDEESIAQKIILNGFTGGRANFQELALLSKYYRWCLGYGDRKITVELINFCKNNDRYFNENLYYSMIQSSVRQSAKYKLRTFPDVQITDLEINEIKKVRNFNYQKILFVLLVISKVLKFSSTRVSNKHPELLGYTVSSVYIRQFILKKFRISQKRFLEISHELYLLGMVEPTYTNALRILYATDRGIPAITIDGFDDIAGCYINYLGGELGYCYNPDCGEEFVKDSHRQKYCKKCSPIIKRNHTRKRVERYRKKNATK